MIKKCSYLGEWCTAVLCFTEPVKKEEAVRTEENGIDGRLQFKEIEIEELDDVEVEDDSSQMEAQVIETDDNVEEDGSSQKGNIREVEDDIEIEELEAEEAIYEADETEDEVHHGSAFTIGKFYRQTQRRLY
nr:unnamed protein product [Callosobruchus analis]